MTNVVIASAARTAVGSFLGSFANTPAHDLGASVIEAVVERAGIEKGEVSETILGQVLTAGQGQNPARQAHINAGLPQESAAWGINQVCGSGLRAVALGAQHIQLGDADIVIAGGQENMSMSDEYIRHGATMEAMQKLRPAFTKDGSVTAANASGLNDGAAATLLMSADNAEKRGLQPLARIASYATDHGKSCTRHRRIARHRRGYFEKAASGWLHRRCNIRRQ